MSGKNTGPPFTRLRTDYEILVEDEGGVAPLAEGIGNGSLAVACEHIPFVDVEPIFAHFGVNGLEARRHWPWVALAAKLYGFDRKRVAAHKTKDLKPSELRESFHRVSRLATNLLDELDGIEVVSRGVGDPKYPWMRDHQEGLWWLLVQGTGGYLDPTMIENVPAQIGFESHYRAFQASLSYLADAARAAPDHMQVDVLTKTVGPRDAALPIFVERTKTIWSSLTSRPPSVGKVHTKAGETPDFVRFVQSVAALVSDDDLTFAQVIVAFRTTKGA